MDPEGKAKVIVKHFKDRFKTRSRKRKLKLLKDTAWLNDKDVKLSIEDKNYLEREITIDEIKVVINELKTNKAAGLDGVTSQMIANMGDLMENKLLELFNYIWISGTLPESWKQGEVVLINKKPPL